MMTIIYDKNGNRKSEINLTGVFNSKIREDIAAKYFEAEKFLKMQPFSNALEAGKQNSAAGTISHKRHSWKGHYGRGMSRIPRKTMWRRGDQFYWIGAEVSGTRGGRRAHPPKLIKRIKKINKKERTIAMNSAIAATAHLDYVNKRYSSLKEFDLSLPIIVEQLPEKTKDLIRLLKHIFKENIKIVIKSKKVRAGKGKMRGRKYKSNAGTLIIIADDEKLKTKAVDVKRTSELRISDLYPLGRLVVFSQKALEKVMAKK